MAGPSLTGSHYVAQAGLDSVAQAGLKLAVPALGSCMLGFIGVAYHTQFLCSTFKVTLKELLFLLCLL